MTLSQAAEAVIMGFIDMLLRSRQRTDEHNFRFTHFARSFHAAEHTGWFTHSYNGISSSARITPASLI
ncbi:hypothetical protein [Paenibacillus glucanolyticus]|uniref:hypothetical protein n=1 Tax=Paenibacillus glucanolyticus TaxID=59843 RepID=UPI00128B0D32|nr:hypothetical protein [Paenibacillus glucanolyticus]MPY15564.1 hypothetical protein [Paenibacillus glucanolyticus]